MLVSLNKETNLSKFRITFIDEDTRHVINLRECKKVHAYKESFYNKDRYCFIHINNLFRCKSNILD